MSDPFLFGGLIVLVVVLWSMNRDTEALERRVSALEATPCPLCNLPSNGSCLDRKDCPLACNNRDEGAVSR